MLERVAHGCQCDSLPEDFPGSYQQNHHLAAKLYSILHDQASGTITINSGSIFCSASSYDTITTRLEGPTSVAVQAEVKSESVI
jgi:hypothetical protein